MTKLWSDDGVKLADATRAPRCPHCGIAAMMGTAAVKPGGLAICAGCTTICRYSSDGKRLERVEILNLSPLDQERCVRAQLQVIDHHRDHGLPNGMHWGRGALCRPCWDDYQPGQEPVVYLGDEWDTCEFCGTRTNSGIYRRMLVEPPESASPGEPS